jgi:hypothetical protein
MADLEAHFELHKISNFLGILQVHSFKDDGRLQCGKKETHIFFKAVGNICISLSITDTIIRPLTSSVVKVLLNSLERQLVLQNSFLIAVEQQLQLLKPGNLSLKPSSNIPICPLSIWHSNTFHIELQIKS